LAELETQTPLLDQEQRDKQQAVNDESAKLANLSAKIEALKSLQEKVKTDGKLKPWLGETWPRQLARPVEQNPHGAWLGKRHGVGPQRASFFFGSFSLGNGQGICL
jgi:hypothetical protein